MRRRNPLGLRGAAPLAMLLAGLPSVAAAADPYPLGALAFFDLPACPGGWELAMSTANQPLNGYFVVPFAQPVPGTLGTPLAAGEDRTHTHTFASSVSVADMGFVAAASCGGLGLCSKMTSSGAQSFTGTTNAVSAGLPYVSYLFCEKKDFAPPRNPPVGIPQYLAAFFRDAACPDGWKPALTTAGRLIVALPATGTPGLSFGGSPLTPGEDRKHTHAFSGQVSLSSQNVCGGTGCCDYGWGKAGTYTFSDTTGPASTGLPYVIVSQCQTCLPGDADPACLGKAE